MPYDIVAQENLEEFIFDEKLFVSYKFVSVRFGIHVNIAKQVLFEFYDYQKCRGKNIYATYYVSGIAPQKWISTIGSGSSGPPAEIASEEDPLDFEDSYYNQDAYLVLLCKEHELEDFKKNFTELFSVHIYGLSSTPLDSYERLMDIVNEPLRDDEGNSIVKYGAITCDAGKEFREDSRIENTLKNITDVKAQVGKEKIKYENEMKAKENAATEKQKMFTSTSTTSTSKSTPVNTNTKKTTDSNGNESNKNRLKNMFASAASRPKPQPKPKEVLDLTDEDDEDNKKTSEKKKEAGETMSSSSSVNHSAKNKPNQRKPTTGKPSKSKQSKSETYGQKRKRIRDVFSSSDDESDAEEKKMSDDDEEGLPESPIPRKKIQIESDSDDEDFKPIGTTKKSPEKSFNKSYGKKRVSKTISQRHVDDEGFLVTVMEHVMVSESDHSENENTDIVIEDKQKSVPVLAKATEKDGKAKVTNSTSSSKQKPAPTAAVGAAKTKQASIMSFFSKKN